MNKEFLQIIGIREEIQLGGMKRTIMYILEDPELNPIIYNVELQPIEWNRSDIIDKLIRSQYSQDRVEAIINNHFLNIAEWLDKKFKGEDVAFEDLEYDKLQEWRAVCKQWADEALAKYPVE
jgi:hypothetical protein